MQRLGIIASSMADGESLNTFIASLSPELWLKFEDSTTGGTGTDSSSNGYSVVYPNGTFSGGGYIYPKRGEPALANGSTYSILTGGGGNQECYVASTFAADFLAGGSWTFGCYLNTTSTTAAVQQFGTSSYLTGAALNYDYVNSANTSGAISLYFDSSLTNANGLVATGTGFNDGNTHALLFEYDATGDTLSIWLDGTEIATRSRAGTLPVSGDFTGASFWVAPAAGFAGLKIDEFIGVQRVLTSGEHTSFASYV